MQKICATYAGDSSESWPRVIQHTVKASQHTHCHLCCSDNKIRHMIFTASKHGKCVTFNHLCVSQTVHYFSLFVILYTMLFLTHCFCLMHRFFFGGFFLFFCFSFFFLFFSCFLYFILCNVCYFLSFFLSAFLVVLLPSI